MIRFREEPEQSGCSSPNQTARNTARSADADRFAVAAGVINSAQRSWANIWAQLKPGVTPAGLVTPQMESNFRPACGWPEFLEELWLLKHYLDYTIRLCEKSASKVGGV